MCSTFLFAGLKKVTSVEPYPFAAVFLHLQCTKNTFDFIFQKNMTNPTILFSLLFLCLLSACTYSGELKEVEAMTNDGKTQYVISFPNYMKLETEKKLGENVSLQYASFYRNVYGLVIDEAKTAASPSLEDYYHQELKKLEEALKNPLRLDSSRVKIADKPTYQIDLVGKVGKGEVEKKIFYRLVFLESERNLHQLVLWGWDERRETYVDDFGGIVNSFRLIN